MSPSSRRLSVSLVRSRLLALPLVLVCALAYVGNVMHFALVQHATCLEHGELVHLKEGSTHASEQVEDSFDDARVASRQEVLEAHDVDAHCVHVFFRREAPPPSQDTAVLAAVSTRSAPALAVFRFHAEPVARLHLAPKASPPRA
ncbi:hypothetical protein JY651_22035 [Pyxidicoccus parkwayensis]|uniref:Uncharacterized protein n=1 Tax=Pyxidicoccus parkwayensis TaxID=2813578 RepID=A0ABX7PAF6_9BACT|nr:hypothetical protein [Pyxidicoccus parkwaysis]QSQ27427.1 hypothetical protein JY651_22035 [Pyxidicoccus parkwaysis]